MKKGSTNWIYFPKSQEPPQLVLDVVNGFGVAS